MKRSLYLIIFVSFLLSSVCAVFADGAQSAGSGQDLLKEDSLTAPTSVQAASSDMEEPIYSNFNSDPVKNHPDHYKLLNIRDDVEPVLIQRIRTHHWNNGKGAEPGTISVYENGSKIGSWQAVGRSAYGTRNVYWDALVDFILYPGHSYYVSVSNVDSMSYNEASGGCGMFELYGIRPAPEGYVPSVQKGQSEQVTIANLTESQTQKPISSVQAPFSIWSDSSAPIYNGSPLPASVGVGYTFRMGRYEQDNNLNNGPEMIEWRVLAVQGDRALVTSKYALDYKAYQDGLDAATWENCSLRKWLNGDFYYSSFTDAEKNQIVLVTNDNPDNPQFRTDGGNSTQDRIFVLSYDEAQKYFKSDQDRICRVSNYAAANYESLVSSVTSDYLHRSSSFSEALWWLRTPGESLSKTVYVDADGYISLYGSTPMILINGTAYNDVRPAFWMKIEKTTCLSVKYNGGSCLAKVPTDKKCYKKGDKVTVLFDPVEYMPGLIFNGWDRTGEGSADHGYYYNSFTMPDHDVELKAICYQPYQNQYNQEEFFIDQYYSDQYDGTTGRDQTPYDPDRNVLYPDYDLEPDYGYVPDYSNNNPQITYPDGPWWNLDGVG